MPMSKNVNNDVSKDSPVDCRGNCRMYNIFVSTTVKTFSSLQVVFNRPSRNIY